MLHAPAEASGRFTYYFDENAYDWHLMAPPPLNRRLSVPWDEALMQKLISRHAGDAPAGGDAQSGTYYMQLSLATRQGGMSSALGADGTSELPMRSVAPLALVERLQKAVRTSPMAVRPASYPYPTTLPLPLPHTPTRPLAHN